MNHRPEMLIGVLEPGNLVIANPRILLLGPVAAQAVLRQQRADRRLVISKRGARQRRGEEAATVNSRSTFQTRVLARQRVVDLPGT